ncbi:MAG: type II toxin-antitoxin system PemK/MazF family toxin [Rhodoplanes sp.]|uniref:type II toxin-antitoxin system PemK/MazF family toxin n=1 Tax=Rhodoplanes sp. TaxID=1968906 RepID=UPI001817B1B8|nr:type II toxin-antitoxin system PemK/MazF family toxin [Rhodoplanes sp.]NVO15428.1 type II toxin-antitoxin system PemK/MazF family toxin [Rhodoplanes sp.]
MKRGDLVLVVLSGDLGKPRPAVVVQADELGPNTNTVLVCPLTSDITEDLPLRPIILPTPEAGLVVRSQIMTDKIVAARRDRIRRQVGRIDSASVRALNAALMVVLGLAG